MNDEFQFRRHFFRAIDDAALEQDDPRYVRIYEGESASGRDPVELLAEAIRFSAGQSIQLLSGFRGTGKTTELKRLASVLLREGYHVVFLDMDDYLNMSTPVDISDFLMAVAGAFGEALKAPEHADEDLRSEGYWARAVTFLTKTKLALPEMSASGIKLNLKNDESFKQKLQKHLEGHIGAMVADVRKFFEECVKALRARHGDEAEVVVIVDSVEHLRGTLTNAGRVQESVEILFSAHAEKLALPYVHLVYTVPTYLKALSMGIGMQYGLGAVPIFPAIKIHDRREGLVHAPGVEALKKIVAARKSDYPRLLGPTDELLERLILMSGGNIRDLLRLLREVIRRAKVLPASESVVEDAIDQMRTEFLPISEEDAQWLALIAENHGAELDSVKRLPDLARFFDTHVVLCYRDGPEWYDVHPLIRDHVMAQARATRARKAKASEPPQES